MNTSSVGESMWIKLQNGNLLNLEHMNAITAETVGDSVVIQIKMNDGSVKHVVVLQNKCQAQSFISRLYNCISAGVRAIDVSGIKSQVENARE